MANSISRMTCWLSLTWWLPASTKVLTRPNPKSRTASLAPLAIDYVHILGHLTGRLLLEREPYKVDQRAVIDACAETGTWIELNSSPSRFDMDWRLWPYARSKGVKCVINCDAHRFEHAGFLRLGAGIARKAGLTRNDVINTLPLEKLRKELQRKRTDF